MSRTRALAIEANPADVRRASQWLEGCAAELAIPPAALHRLDLCLHEVLANLIDHGGAEVCATPVQLEIAVDHRLRPGQARLLVSDSGRCFDPLSHTGGDLPRSLAEAEPGGLGLVMLRAFSDELHYQHRDGRNELRLRINWGVGGEALDGHDRGEPGTASLRISPGPPLPAPLQP